MKESQMRKGMHVLISSTKVTKKTHTSTRIMDGMVGEIHIIKYIAFSRYGKAAIIKGYHWHPSDLSFPKVKTEKPKIEYFDDKELVI